VERPLARGGREVGRKLPGGRKMEGDLVSLSQQFVQYLPLVLEGGKFMLEKAASKLSEELGKDALEKLKAIWARLKKKPRVEQAVQACSALPGNQAMQQALVEEIARALREEPTLAEELRGVFASVKHVHASGARSVAIGGDVKGSVIITGDQNVVGPRGEGEDD